MEWISIKDRMPEIGRWVVVHHDKAHEVPKVCSYSENGFWEFGNLWPVCVTHWFYLPPGEY